MSEILHLTPGASGYRKGCRCEACTLGNRQASANRRARLNGGTPARQKPGPRRPSDSPDAGAPEMPSGSAEGHAAPLGAAGDTETKTEARIEAIWKAAGMGKWDAEAEAWEDQAMQAARAIDSATWSGKIHQTPAQWRLLNDAIRELRAKLALADGSAVPANPGQEDFDLFVAGLHHASVMCQPDFPDVVPGDCSECDRAQASAAEYARRHPEDDDLT